jgi:hypothetical protein
VGRSYAAFGGFDSRALPPFTSESASRIFDEKTDAPSYEIKVVSGSSRAELLFSVDGKLTKTQASEKK